MQTGARDRIAALAAPGGLLTPLLGGFLCLCWLLGGVVEAPGPSDEILQLAALPLVVHGCWRVSSRVQRPVAGVALVLAAAIAALPLLQLVPLPSLPALQGGAREALAADELLAGDVRGALAPISVSTLATERALWSLMPALALFLGGLALPPEKRRRMLQVILAMVFVSAAFGFHQLSLPDDSPELLYTTWGRNFGGLFINPNHQGTALVMGAVIAAALFVDGQRRARDGAPGRLHWFHAVWCAACVLMIPLARGNAAVLLGFIGLVAVLAMLRVVPWRAYRHRWARRLCAVGLVVAVAAVLSAALVMRWHDEERATIAAQTARIGLDFAPAGSGMGSFVKVYLQEQELRSARTKTINHAHHEYLQWWLEGGVPAMLVACLGLAVFGWAGWYAWARIDSRRARAVAAAAWTCLLVLLLHSIVDFPLRTTTMMATAGLLLGLLFNVLANPGHAQREMRHRDPPHRRA